MVSSILVWGIHLLDETDDRGYVWAFRVRALRLEETGDLRRISVIGASTRFLFAAEDAGSTGVIASPPVFESTEIGGAAEVRKRTGAPVFVVGFMRSGTSLLWAMLDAHPKLAMSLDSMFIPRFWTIRSRYGTNDHLDARRLVSDVMSFPRVREWELPEGVVSATLETLGESSFADAVRAVFEMYAKAQGKPAWGDKTPGYVIRMPLLASLFPDARFVHVIRDGRDATLSCMDRGVIASNVAVGADRWRQRASQGMAEGRSLGSRRYLEVRYEELVADPSGALTSVCEFLGLEFDARMLGYMDRAISVVPERSRYRHDNLAKPPTPGLRDWRRDMSSSDVAVFESIAGHLLDELGYERGVARIPISSRLSAWRLVASARARGRITRIADKARGRGSVDGDRT